MKTPPRAALARLDRRRKKRTSNKDWENPSAPYAKITKMKDGRTHLAHKAEHAVDLDTGALLAVIVQGALGVRSYIAEPDRGRRSWAKAPAEHRRDKGPLPASSEAEGTAKFHEHRAQDLESAHDLVRGALDLKHEAGTPARVVDAFRHRLGRLNRRLAALAGGVWPRVTGACHG